MESLDAVGGFDGLVAMGRHGVADGPAGVTVRPLGHLAMASLAVRGDRHEALAAAALAAFGVALPTTPVVARSPGLAFAWAGPGRWLVLAEDGSPEARLREHLGQDATVTAQSDGRAVLRVSGPRARDALAKGVPIDLHPRAFPPDATAVTAVAHVPVQLWRAPDSSADEPAYDLAVPRSYAGSVTEWLLESAAPFGVEVAA